MSGRRAESKRRNTDALLAAARRLFLADGYQAVGIQAIATEADLTIGAIYSLFGSKQALLHAVLANLADQVESEVRVLAAEPEVDAREAVTRYVRAYHRLVSTVDGWRALRLEVEALSLVLGSAEPERALGEFGAGSRRALAGLLTGRVLDGRRLGEPRAERAAVAVSAVVRGLAVQCAVEPGVASGQRWVELALAVLAAS
ncbi:MULTISPECIES: TetR/AcrR family transcriptional regulator [unclassified Crossiella]|uniref:TetR/AcrR family transcriptional regulator n=1 Tax=unclassified Crossiella TaxID=2620835 RepID=UPI001FFEF2F7|nr:MULTISPECIES: TetR/AcrR family transcriptional regulator [unclassified Crossiella]MCK2243063.1 TetR/AcrR family transcriptional regulator [Crossiella sp. S99.2]MCK2256940.1 TetR/AcrR family transcriptional regulator [Crossiella sp. S99.1]